MVADGGGKAESDWQGIRGLLFVEILVSQFKMVAGRPQYIDGLIPAQGRELVVRNVSYH